MAQALFEVPSTAPPTQNQALAALLFLYRELLERDLDLEGVVRARTRQRLPVVLTPEEVRAVLERLDGVEALRLRVHDLDFDRHEPTVRDGKGGKDRRTLLPNRLGDQLRGHLEDVRRTHRADLAQGWGRVLLPHALARKYPHASVEWGWQWVFPQHHRWCDSEGCATCCAGGRTHEAGDLSHAAPLVCHPSQ
ncbi:hypothetical protein [Synechococcus sp. CS-1328]|uniref:hypothetical protein n=1 Tax=Synechococcus sp. CS-1328 TaxID=2847976 RepID=UPI0037D9D954